MQRRKGIWDGCGGGLYETWPSPGTRWDQQGMGSAFGKPTVRQDFMELRGLMRGDITSRENRHIDDLSARLETISSLRRADPRVNENVGTWKLNNKIKLNHRLSAQDVAEKKIQQKICWPI